MTHRIRNVVIAFGLALVAMMITLLYVSNYKRSVENGQAQVQVYVAGHDIAAGATGSDLASNHALRTIEVKRNTVVPGAISSPAEILALVVGSPIYSGEQITLRQFTNVAAQGIRAQLTGALRAVQVAGDANQLLAGTLQDGDHVDVVANLHVNPNAESGNTNATRIVLHDIEVLVAPKDVSSVAQVTPNGQSSVILGLTDSQALKLFFVMKNADWTLELRPATGATNSPDQVDSLPVLLGGGAR